MHSKQESEQHSQQVALKDQIFKIKSTRQQQSILIILLILKRPVKFQKPHELDTEAKKADFQSSTGTLFVLFDKHNLRSFTNAKWEYMICQHSVVVGIHTC